MSHPRHEDPSKTASRKEDRRQVVEHEVRRLLDRVPAYRELDPATRRALGESMTNISSYLSDMSTPPALARPLAPDLRSSIGRQGSSRSPASTGGTVPVGGPDDTSNPPATTGTSPVGRVAEVTRSTLNAIDFPTFVASLIKGTFGAIVDSSIAQMEAYAELVQNVAGSVDQFMQDNISDGVARDYLADRFPGYLNREIQGEEMYLTVQPDALPEGELPSFFRDLGFDSAHDVDEQTLEEIVVPATRQTLAEQRQQVLSTMVLMGINRVVVDEGEINAKLQFHIDASEDMNIRFDENKTVVGDIAGGSSAAYSAQGILVNTTSLNTQSDLNLRTDLTGEVKVRFRSETFPLERFADSAAIQLINNHAKVPSSGDSGNQTAGGETSGAVNDPWAPK